MNHDDEINDERGADYGDPRRCPRHPSEVTSSNDGLFDAPCGLCEAAMEEPPDDPPPPPEDEVHDGEYDDGEWEDDSADFPDTDFYEPPDSDLGNEF